MYGMRQVLQHWNEIEIDNISGRIEFRMAFVSFRRSATISKIY